MNIRERLRQGAWIGLHILILGSFVHLYTLAIRDISTQKNFYLAMGVFTAFLVIYVCLVVLVDRIARRLNRIADQFESISDSVQNISESISDETSNN